MDSFRGKAAAAIDNDEWNLAPPVTYRHVHSQSAGTHNPLRIIGLIDMDAFYAQAEQKRLGIDPTLPVVVLQWDSLIAVNYPARKFGIARMTKLKEAQKMCPELVVVHVATYKDGENEAKYHPDPNNKTHKVSLDLYRRESVKIINIFKTTLPTAEVEKASVDEAFIDFTIPVQQTLLERYPELAAPSPNSGHDMDSPLPSPPESLDWHPSCNMVALNDEDELDLPSPAALNHENTAPDEGDKWKTRSVTWQDVALSIGAELLFKARKEVLQTLGYTTSAGIARNKFLAKVERINDDERGTLIIKACSIISKASEPVLRNAAIPFYLSSMPFQKIRFLGGKLGAVIAEEYEAKTVGDLHSIDLGEMQTKFGPESIWVYQVLRGIDHSEVKEKPPVNKSMLASKNLPTPIRKDAETLQWIKVLCSELAVRLNEARETGTVWPKTIALHTKQVGESAPRSKQGPFPYVRDLTGEVIVSAAMKLWKELHGTDAERAANPNVPKMKIINISIAFTGVAALEQGQRGIEGFFGSGQAGTSAAQPKEVAPKEEDVSEKLGEIVEYHCPKCSKKLPVPVEHDDDTETRAAKLFAVQAEHGDYHFAQQLSREDKLVVGGGGGAKRRHSPSRAAPKKRNKDGIMTYFQKK